MLQFVCGKVRQGSLGRSGVSFSSMTIKPVRLLRINDA